MTAALLYALLTGLSWTAIGVVLKSCARGSFDVVAYSLMQSVLAGILCFFLYTDGKVPVSTAAFGHLAAVILTAAALNALAQNLVRTAMSRGDAAPVWAMAQAAMLFPFLAGVFFFGGRISLGNCGGLLLILSGVFLPARGKFQRVRSWYLPALAALLCYGILQTLYLLPSHLAGFADPGNWRAVLVCAGNFTGWSIIGAVRKKTQLQFSRKAFFIALLMAVVHAAGVRTFFLALDALSAIRRGGLGMPLMIGINLAGFGLFSRFCSGEKERRESPLPLLLILSGVLLLATD